MAARGGRGGGHHPSEECIVRIEVHVRPGAARTVVGGSHDGALVVRVAAPPDRGRATRAVLQAVADALGVSPGSITLARGVRARRKVVEITIPATREAHVRQRLARLTAEPGD